MVKTNELRALMTREGLTQEQLAKIMEISPKTLCRKLSTGKFGCDEVKVMIDTLHIKNPMEIFFA